MTLISNIYDYTALSRKEINGSRKYVTPDGNAVASVTTILSATADKSHLVAWRNRLGPKKAQEITTEAAGVGTRMHKYLEDYVKFGEWPSPGSNPYAKKANAMASKIRDKALIDMDEIWGSEVSLYVPKIYAGTTDLVGQYKGNPAVCDFKQSNRPKKGEWVEDYMIQLTAYIIAHNEIYRTNIQHGHIFLCTRDLEYQQFNLTPEPDPYFHRTFNDWTQVWWGRVYQFYENNCA